MMKIQRKMYEANKALAYFVTHNWNFKNENFLNLENYLRNEDLRNFMFIQFFYHDVLFFVRKAVYGFRRYLMNLKDEDLEKDRKFYKIYAMIFNGCGMMLKFILFLLTFNYFLNKF